MSKKKRNYTRILSKLFKQEHEQFVYGLTKNNATNITSYIIENGEIKTLTLACDSSKELL